MKRLCTALVLLPVVAFAAGLIDRNDQTMNGSWTFNKSVTVQGTTTLNGAVTVAGVMTYTGAPVFSANVEIDDGAGDSPTLKLIDADNKYLVIQKLDAGGGNITNNEGAINLLPSGDTDDYITISTTGDVPHIATTGTCNLTISPSGGQVTVEGGLVTYDFTAYDGITHSPVISIMDADTKSLKLQKLDTGDATILNEEAAIQVQASGDTDDYFTFTTTSNVPSFGTAGACDLDLAPAAALNIKASGDVDDYLTVTTVTNVPTIGTAGTANLTIAPDGGTTNVTGALAASGAVTGNGGLGLGVVSQVVAFGDFTNNEDATAYIDLTSQIPAGSIVLGWECVVATGFTGTTTCTVQVGVAGALDKYSAVTDLSIFAAGTVGSTVKAGNVYEAAAATVRVTATEDSDWDDVTAGSMTVNVWYIATP